MSFGKSKLENRPFLSPPKLKSGGVGGQKTGDLSGIEIYRGRIRELVSKTRILGFWRFEKPGKLANLEIPGKVREFSD